MTPEEVEHLISDGAFPEATTRRELIETHISWVILCDAFVYKIKKPIKYSFLDFTTLPDRLHFCRREGELNRRFTEDVYLGVTPIYRSEGRLSLGSGDGEIVDYAVRMRKLNPDKRMDILLKQDRIRPIDIDNIARKIAAFHREAETIDHTEDRIGADFDDLETVKSFLGEALGPREENIIDRAMVASSNFLERHRDRMRQRTKSGLYRDCHGDLHTRNIFVLPDPVPFDCIEFNDAFRHIDVLNEVAFLCMDLDAFGRPDLSAHFLNIYSRHFPALQEPEDEQLFTYYKAYRANIRAKVNGLRAMSATTETEKNQALQAASEYLHRMAGYLETI